MAYDKLCMIDDIGRTFSAIAANSITNGDLVMYGGTANAVGSDVSTYALTDIYVLKASGTAGTPHTTVLGIALTTASSGNSVAVSRKGVYILPAASGGVTGGNKVQFLGYNNMVGTALAGSPSDLGTKLGTALTAASDQTGFVIVALDF